MRLKTVAKDYNEIFTMTASIQKRKEEGEKKTKKERKKERKKKQKRTKWDKETKDNWDIFF